SASAPECTGLVTTLPLPPLEQDQGESAPDSKPGFWTRLAAAAWAPVVAATTPTVARTTLSAAPAAASARLRAGRAVKWGTRAMTASPVRGGTGGAHAGATRRSRGVDRGGRTGRLRCARLREISDSRGCANTECGFVYRRSAPNSGLVFMLMPDWTRPVGRSMV